MAPTEQPNETWMRLRPYCAEHGEHADWLWRCFCFSESLSGEDDPFTGRPGGWQPFPQLCRCEATGFWACPWDAHETPAAVGVPA